MNRLFCLGYGYTAQHLNALLNSQEWEVRGTSRDPEASNLIQFRGAQDLQNIKEDLHKATHLLVSIPPMKLASMLKGLDFPNLKWLGVLSSTGVYGDHQGAWVDEWSPCHPTSESGQTRLQDEGEWLELFKTQNLPVHIFRLSGIYGPCRNYFQSLQAGTAQRIYKEGVVFSRIHVDDIANVLNKSMLHPTPGEIYNVADDLPAAPWEVMEYAAQLLRVQAPPLIDYNEAHMSPMLKAFYQDTKRVSNQKIKSDLGVSLRYPTYKEGLKALVSDFKKD